VLYLGRVLTEAMQFADDPADYFHNFWNCVDILLFIVQTVAFTLRCHTILEFARRGYDPVTSAVPTDIAELNQIQFDFSVFGLILLMFRYIETLTYNSRMGEVFVMLREMIKDSIAVLAYMLLLAVVAGIAFSVGLPRGSRGGSASDSSSSHLPEVHHGHP
jgi:hypothetical protein